MSTFYERLLQEKTELDEKKQKLDEFLSSDKISSIDPIQISFLNIQSQIMGSYSQVLLERITYLNK